MMHSIAQKGFVLMAQLYGLAIVVCLVVWAATGADYFWPGWVILGVVLKVGIMARLVYGRSSFRRS